jgi:hypothetical protein
VLLVKELARRPDCRWQRNWEFWTCDHLLLFKVCHRAHFLNTCDKLKKPFFDDKPEDVLICCWSRTPITAVDNSTAIKLNTQMHTLINFSNYKGSELKGAKHMGKLLSCAVVSST